MSKEPNRNIYVGHRYVPKIMGEWDKSTDYEGLSIVTYQGASYTSKKRVPVGIDILNEEFWVITGNYDAQVEYYRDETERVSKKLDSKADLTYLDNELDIKADLTYLDSELDNHKKDTTDQLNILDDKVDRTDIQIEYFSSILESIDYGENNNTLINGNNEYIVNSNIDDFLGSQRKVKKIFTGNGSVKRGDHVFYFSPKGEETNTIFVSSQGNITNDGLTPDKAVPLNVALNFIASCGDVTTDGNWEIKIVGHYNGIGFRNVKLPFFKNPLVISGERNEDGTIKTIVDGSGINDNYFIRMDTGSAFQKFFEVKDIKFINWNNSTTASGPMVFWDNTDIHVHDCESEFNSLFLWVRNGRLRAYDNKHDGGYSGISVQYHTSFNISRNTITNCTRESVHIGRNSAGHVSGNTFEGNRFNIEATQSSRLRTYDNIHKDWGDNAIQLYHNATWEGYNDDIIEYNFTKDKPFYNTFYGSGIAEFQAKSSMNRHQYSFPFPIFEISTTGIFNLNENGFSSPLRAYKALLNKDDMHIKIKYVVHSSTTEDPGNEFDIIFAVNDDYENGYLTLPVKAPVRVVGDIEIDIYTRKGSTTNYAILKYHDGETIQSSYHTYSTSGMYTGNNQLVVTRAFINNKKGTLRILGFTTEISQ